MKKTHIVLLVFIAVCIGVVISMTGSFSKYETFNVAKAAEGHEFHVIGQLVKEAEMSYDPKKDPNYFSFYMADKNGEKQKVVFIGTKPQDFERSEQIVLTGKMMGQEFHADKILMKCPSKYINDKLDVKDKLETKEYKAVRTS